MFQKQLRHGFSQSETRFIFTDETKWSQSYSTNIILGFAVCCILQQCFWFSHTQLQDVIYCSWILFLLTRCALFKFVALHYTELRANRLIFTNHTTKDLSLYSSTIQEHFPFSCLFICIWLPPQPWNTPTLHRIKQRQISLSGDGEERTAVRQPQA